MLNQVLTEIEKNKNKKSIKPKFLVLTKFYTKSKNEVNSSISK